MSIEKSPYKISYTVGLNYITPAARQRVGMSGNHNVTMLEFAVDNELRNAVENYAATSYVRYRFDIYNAADEVFRTESQDVNESSHEDYVFPYTLQERDTRYGGTVKVHLVLTAFDGAEVVKEVICRPALLQLEGTSHGTSRYSYTELEQKALAAADAAAIVKQAYDSGEFKGEKGDAGPVGPKGDSYILTEADKAEISGKVATHEKYFDITPDGKISLKPEYRGAAGKKYYSNDVITYTPEQMSYCISDNGVGYVGSKNCELPREISIPLTVNGITVTDFQMGIFAFNERITQVTLNPNITTIPSTFVYRAVNFEALHCTEQITTVKTASFSCTKIKKLEMPNLEKTSGAVFHLCSQLEYVDMGKITALGNKFNF